MRNNKSFTLSLWLASALFILIASACGGGDDDDDSDGGGIDDDTLPVDDDAADDDDADDDAADDDTTDDDTTDDDTVDDDTTPADDDTTPPDPDTEYPSLHCAIADPEGLGEGLLIGGTPGDTIIVYVFDDQSCEPLDEATVLAAGETFTTDETGRAEVDLARDATLVTATKDGYIAWSYEADAGVMYFRIRPVDLGYNYASNPMGHFVSEGTPLALENPTVNGLLELGALLNDPIYLGLTIPGVSRQTLLQTDFLGILTAMTYNINIDTPLGGYYISPNHNFYIPQLTITDVLGISLTMPDHDFYQIPLAEGTTELPVTGMLLEADLGAVLTLENLTALIQAFLNGEDITQALLELVKPAIQDGLSIIDVGARPAWDATGNPDLEVTAMAGQEFFTVTIENAAADADYLGLMLAEIANRTLTPLDLNIAAPERENWTMDLASADIPDGDFILAAVKTDLVTSNFDLSDMSFAFKFSPFYDTWAGGASFADADFLPYFDGEATAYDAGTQTITWALESKAAVDAYFLFYYPADTCTNCTPLMAVFPGTTNSYQIPAELGFTGSEDDIIVLVGLNLPEGVNANEWNPLNFLSYEIPAATLWMHPTLMDLIMSLFPSE